MRETTKIQCSCGKTRLEVSGKPIASIECCCKSCRDGSERLQTLDGAPDILTTYDATPYIMVRKDRVNIIAGAENLTEFRLSPNSKTRRVFASCCNTPIFVEFRRGHWLSLFALLWPDAKRPNLELRTMAGDAPTGAVVPDDVPNAKSHTPRFFAKLLGAWIGMGFRVPKGPAAKKVEL